MPFAPFDAIKIAAMFSLSSFSFAHRPNVDVADAAGHDGNLGDGNQGSLLLLRHVRVLQVEQGFRDFGPLGVEIPAVAA
jgi:hypothetical protein